MLYRGKNKVKVYKGGYGAPTNNSLAGWTPEIQTGKNLSFENTYKDVVSPLIIKGASNQTKTTQSKNLFDLNLVNGTYSNATSTVVISSGTITITPVVGSTATYVYCDVPCNQHFSAGTYFWYHTVTRKDTESNYASVGYLRVLDGETAYKEEGRTAITTTVGFTITYLRIYFRITDNTATTSGQYNTYNNFQFESGSTATNYVPFVPNSPSPYYHSNIVSAGDIEKDVTITAHGKNLFNKDIGIATSLGTFVDGVFVTNIGINNYYAIIYCDFNVVAHIFKPNHTYTFIAQSDDDLTNNFCSAVFYGNRTGGQTYLSVTGARGATKFKITFTDDWITHGNFEWRFDEFGPKATVTRSRTYYNLMIIEGDYVNTTLPYIPYFNPSTITYNKVLRGIPATYNADGSVATWAYRDWIDNDTGLIHRQTYEPIILTGTEAIGKNDAVTTNYLYYMSSVPLGVPITGNTKCLISHLQYSSAIMYGGSRVVGYTVLPEYPVIFINLGYALIDNTVAGIKAWMAAEYAKGTPFTLLISRGTEITEPITAQPLATTPRYCDINSNSEITATVKIMNT